MTRLLLPALHDDAKKGGAEAGVLLIRGEHYRDAQVIFWVDEADDRAELPELRRFAGVRNEGRLLRLPALGRQLPAVELRDRLLPILDSVCRYQGIRPVARVKNRCTFRQGQGIAQGDELGQGRRHLRRAGGGTRGGDPGGEG